MRIVALIYLYIGVWKELRGGSRCRRITKWGMQGWAGRQAGMRAGIGRQQGGEHSAREGARAREGVTHMLHAH